MPPIIKPRRVTRSTATLTDNIFTKDYCTIRDKAREHSEVTLFGITNITRTTPSLRDSRTEITTGMHRYGRIISWLLSQPQD